VTTGKNRYLHGNLLGKAASVEAHGVTAWVSRGNRQQAVEVMFF
jgi:hypothetical protein